MLGSVAGLLVHMKYLRNSFSKGEDENMALLRKIGPGHWQGIVTGRMYYAPRECEESAEAQEQQHVQTLPLKMPTDVKAGSPEYIKYEVQHEALSNVEQDQIRKTVVGYREFIERHPEYVRDDPNSANLVEYLSLKGKRLVAFNGADVPLNASVEDWEEAFQWKCANQMVRLDPGVMNAQEQLKAQARAKEYLEHKEPSEDELYAMPWAEFDKRARGLL